MRMEEVTKEIEMLLAVAPEEVPQESRFLLKIDFAYNSILTLESKSILDPGKESSPCSATERFSPRSQGKTNLAGSQ